MERQAQAAPIIMMNLDEVRLARAGCRAAASGGPRRQRADCPRAWASEPESVTQAVLPVKPDSAPAAASGWLSSESGWSA